MMTPPNINGRDFLRNINSVLILLLHHNIIPPCFIAIFFFFTFVNLIADESIFMSWKDKYLNEKNRQMTSYKEFYVMLN